LNHTSITRSVNSVSENPYREHDNGLISKQIVYLLCNVEMRCHIHNRRSLIVLFWIRWNGSTHIRILFPQGPF